LAFDDPTLGQDVSIEAASFASGRNDTSSAPCAYGEIAGQLGFGAGREGSCFFMADVHPLHLLVVMNGIHDAIQGIAYDAINPADARIYQCLYQMFSDGCYGFARLFL
jgi:hypothetical protein